MNNQKESKLSFKNIFQRETKLATYIIVCCTILVLGISYAVFFQVNQNSNNQVVEAGDLTFTYQDGNQITSSSKSSCFEPMSDDEAGLFSSNCAYQFSVQNTGSLMGSYTLTLTANSANTAPADQVKVILKRQNAEGILETVESYPKKVSEITNGILLENGEINVGESIVYSIQLYVDESTVTDPNVDSGTAYNIDYMINGTATVHENQDISSEVSKTAVDTIKEIAASNPDKIVDDGTTDHNLRYVGANPNNYVSFNGELWRIMGVMNNTQLENGNTVSLLKLIRDESIGNYSFDNTMNYGNQYSEAAIMETLNSGPYWNRTSGECPYQTGAMSSTTTIACDMSEIGLQSDAKTMIENVIWKYNPVNLASTMSEIYTQERTGDANWIGYVGLVYPSDYLYSANLSEECQGMTAEQGSNNCYSDSYVMENMGYTISPLVSTSNLTIRAGSGLINAAVAAWGTMYIYPSVYLNSNVMITGGDGSESKPFTLGL